MDPYGGYNFKVEWDGIIQAGFKTCSGLDTSQDAGTYREGTDKGLEVRKLPGLITSANITLVRGITDNAELWQWRNLVMQGKVADARKNVSIVLMDDEGTEKVRWNLRNAWPTKWTGPSFDATSSEVALETLEIAHEGLSMA
jgi:phage tail-like protein